MAREQGCWLHYSSSTVPVATPVAGAKMRYFETALFTFFLTANPGYGQHPTPPNESNRIRKLRIIPIKEFNNYSDAIHFLGLPPKHPRFKIENSTYERGTGKLLKSGRVLFLNERGQTLKEHKFRTETIHFPGETLHGPISTQTIHIPGVPDARPKKGGTAHPQYIPPRTETRVKEGASPLPKRRGILMRRFGQDAEDPESIAFYDSSGTIITELRVSYAWAAPNLQYFITSDIILESKEDISVPRFAVRFFDRSGKEFARTKVFKFFDRPKTGFDKPRVVFTEDSRYVLVAAHGTEPPDEAYKEIMNTPAFRDADAMFKFMTSRPIMGGIALLKSTGELVWAVEENDWQIYGPLDEWGHLGDGDILGDSPETLLVSPESTFFFYSKKGVSCYELLTGRLVWNFPKVGYALIPSPKWDKLMVFNPSEIYVLDPHTGNVNKQLASPSSGVLGHAKEDKKPTATDEYVIFPLEDWDSTTGKRVRSKVYVMDWDGQVLWKDEDLKGEGGFAGTPHEKDWGGQLLDGNKIIIREPHRTRVFAIGGDGTALPTPNVTQRVRYSAMREGRSIQNHDSLRMVKFSAMSFIPSNITSVLGEARADVGVVPNRFHKGIDLRRIMQC